MRVSRHWWCDGNRVHLRVERAGKMRLEMSVPVAFGPLLAITVMSAAARIVEK